MSKRRPIKIESVSIVQTYILQLKQAHPGPDSAPLVGFNCTNLHPSTETWIAWNAQTCRLSIGCHNTFPERI